MTADDLKKIKGLVFDAYGTLFDTQSVVALGEQLFPGQGKALSETWRRTQLQYTWLRSLMGRYVDFWKVTEDGLASAARSLNLKLDPTKLKRLMNAYLSLSTFADVSPALKELSTAGYKLAILSNGAPGMLEQVVKNAGIDQLLTQIISVDEVQIYKPSPLVYELAPKTLALAGEAIGFISSNSWDIAGAMSFGLTTFWINRGNQPAEELGFPAHRVMGKLTELLPLLRGG